MQKLIAKRALAWKQFKKRYKMEDVRDIAMQKYLCGVLDWQRKVGRGRGWTPTDRQRPPEERDPDQEGQNAPVTPTKVDESRAKAACRRAIQQFVDGWFQQREHVLKENLTVTSYNQQLIYMNLGAAPGHLLTLAPSEAANSFDVDRRLEFMSEIIKQNRTSRMLFLEGFGRYTPEAMRRQKEVLDSLCRDHALIHSIVESGCETVIYIVPSGDCGGQVTATRVDEMQLETEHARPAALFAEASGLHVLGKHTKANGGPQAKSQRRTEVVEHGDTIKTVESKSGKKVISAIDANMLHRTDADKAIIQGLEDNGIFMAPSPAVDKTTKALEPSSNVHSGPPDQKRGQTQLYDVCMSTCKVEASIHKLDCMVDLYRDLWDFVEHLPQTPPAGVHKDAWADLRCFGHCRRASFNRVFPDHHIVSIDISTLLAEAA